MRPNNFWYNKGDSRIFLASHTCRLNGWLFTTIGARRDVTKDVISRLIAVKLQHIYYLLWFCHLWDEYAIVHRVLAYLCTRFWTAHASFFDIDFTLGNPTKVAHPTISTAHWSVSELQVSWTSSVNVTSLRVPATFTTELFRFIKFTGESGRKQRWRYNQFQRLKQNFDNVSWYNHC